MEMLGIFALGFIFCAMVEAAVAVWLMYDPSPVKGPMDCTHVDLE
jgi:hypothetical protein